MTKSITVKIHKGATLDANSFTFNFTTQVATTNEGLCQELFNMDVLDVSAQQDGSMFLSVRHIVSITIN